MSDLAEGLRESLAAYAALQAEGRVIDAAYARISETETVSYNGSHYMLFLDKSRRPPKFHDSALTLWCETATKMAWRLPYSYATHIAKLRSTAIVASANTLPVDPAARIIHLSKQNAMPWVILGVPRNADANTVTAAYRKLAVLTHPDRHPNNSRVSEAFVLLQQAKRLMLSP